MEKIVDKNSIVSVIIVNYNGFEYVQKCIESIFSSTDIEYEVIVVDNKSTDDSIIRIKNEFCDRVVLVSLDKNYGPAYARNEGAKIAKGEILSFLDNDTEVHPNWIDSAKQIFHADKTIGSIQCKLLLYNDRTCIDYAGEYLAPNGFLVQVAETGVKDQGQFDDTCEILAAKSAGMFIRKSVFEKIGGFDSDYFIYMEETDLGLRVWLSGYKVVFNPNSIVYHHFSTSKSILGEKTTSANVRFHGTKNYVMTLLKNLNAFSLFKMLPKHIALWSCFALFRLLTGNVTECKLIFKGIFWNIIHIRETLEKRKIIQSQRVIEDSELMEIIVRKKSALYKAHQYFLGTKFLAKLSKYNKDAKR